MGAPGLISQFSGRKIRCTYHGDHLRPFHKREGYLSTAETFRESQIIWPQLEKEGTRYEGWCQGGEYGGVGRKISYIAWVIRDSNVGGELSEKQGVYQPENPSMVADRGT